MSYHMRLEQIVAEVELQVERQGRGDDVADALWDIRIMLTDLRDAVRERRDNYRAALGAGPLLAPAWYGVNRDDRVRFDELVWVLGEPAQGEEQS